MAQIANGGRTQAVQADGRCGAEQRPRPADLNGIPLDGDRRRHKSAVRRDVENLLAVPPPARRTGRSATFRTTISIGPNYLHCQAARAEDTDWPQILSLYDLLDRLQPSPIVFLNRAVAVAMVAGPQPALALIDSLTATGALDEYHLLHAARADLLRRAGALGEAAKSYARALALVTNDSERRFLERRLREVQTA
jgi:predicted RNA polymerase sigma factor